MLQVEVDLLGLARRAVGQKHVSLTLADNSSYQDLVRQLAELYPALVGQVINPQTRELYSTFMFNQDGRRVIRDLTLPLVDGEALTLMFVESGG